MTESLITSITYKMYVPKSYKKAFHHDDHEE